MLTKKKKLISIDFTGGDVKYDLTQAVGLVRKFATCKFDETVEIVFNLDIDPQRSEQVVKGFVNLPHGSGKKVRVAVVTSADSLEEAKSSSADVVGSTELIADMAKGNLEYDVIVATPDVMLDLSKIGRILGPKKLMPNPKLGTVTTDIVNTVSKIKLGQVNIASDKNGIVHSIVGKVSYPLDWLLDNITFMIKEVSKMRPASVKGVFIKSICLCSTMGPSVLLDFASLVKK